MLEITAEPNEKAKTFEKLVTIQYYLMSGYSYIQPMLLIFYLCYTLTNGFVFLLLGLEVKNICINMQRSMEIFIPINTDHSN